MTVAGMLIQFLFPYVIIRWALAFVLGSVTLFSMWKIWDRYFRKG